MKDGDDGMEADLKTAQPTEARLGKAEAIQRAARELFARRGYGDVSMDEVARVAGVSKATIYSHFKDKEELFAGLMRAECAMSWVRSELAERSLDNVRGTLVELASSYASVLSDKSTLTRMVIAEARRFPALAEIFFDSGPCSSRHQLAIYLGRAAAAGLLAITDPQRAADQFFALLRNDTHLRILLGLPVSEDDVADAVDSAIEMFFKAYDPAR